MPERVELPRRPEADEAVCPHHVEVRLAARRNLGGLVGAELPDRVDLQQAAHDAENARRHREERAGLDREHRHHAHAHDIGLGAPGARELRVLLEPHQRQVRTDERQDDARYQQDVQRVQPRDDDADRAVVSGTAAREVTAEQCPVQPRADNRNAHRDARECGAQAGSGQQVVGQRVSEEALEHGQYQQQRADHPVGLTGTPESAGEENAGQVDHDRSREKQCGPVVDLADEQTAAHLEADVEGGREGSRHLDATERLIHAVVGDIDHRRVEEQAQVHAGEQQNDEAVQGDLTQQKRPVGGEHLVELSADSRRGVVARVDRVALFCQGGRFWQFRTHDRRSQNAGPTGSMKSPLATRYPSWSMVIGSCASARAAGPNMGRAKCSASNCDWWHGQRMR